MWRRLRSARQLWTRTDEFERELEAEMASHMAEHAAALIASGVEPSEARRRARVDFGSPAIAKEECREATAFSALIAGARDLRYGFRLLRRAPGFAAVAIITLALCIGANTAVFSIVDAVLFRPLAYPAPDRLAQVALGQRGTTAVDDSAFNGAQWEVLHGATSLDTAAYSDLINNVNVVSSAGAASVRQQRVSAGFFRVLGVAPMLGREILPDEDRTGGASVALLSYPLWQQTFAGDRALIGKTVLIRGESHTVVGVMPATFQSTQQAALWTPLRPSREGEGEGENYQIVGRLRAGATWAGANGELDILGRSIFGREHAQTVVRAMPLQEMLSQPLRRPLLILWGAVGMVLLIGCVNLAGLLLARATTRGREIATRLALGGGRGPILRQLLAEALALGLCGAVGGVVLGALALGALRRLAATLRLPYVVHIDLRVLAMTLAVALLATLLFSIVPALRLSRLPLAAVLAESGTRVAGRAPHWTRRTLVLTEIGLSVVLLYSASLLIRSFTYLRDNARGFHADGLTAGTVSLEDSRYETAVAVRHLFDVVLEQTAAYPGVDGAAVALTLPYERPLNIGIRAPDGRQLTVNMVYVSPDFFRVLGTPLLRGRGFTAADDAGSARVMIVNDSFARSVLGGRPPLGTSIKMYGEKRAVVGVAGNIVQRPGFGEFMPVDITPTAYVPAAQLSDGMVQVHVWFSPSFIVRARDRGVATEAMRRAVAGADPYLSLASVRSFDEVANEALAIQRFQAVLMGSLSVLALLLAGVGVGGLIATNVSERKREIGIRMALGATRGRAVVAASLPGIVLSMGGLAAGALAAPMALRVLRRFLWGVAPSDPATLAGVLGILLVTALVASVGPALRIVRIEPARILRQ
jgi:predicted permease